MGKAVVLRYNLKTAFDPVLPKPPPNTEVRRVQGKEVPLEDAPKQIGAFVENGGEKLGHGSGGMELLRAA